MSEATITFKRQDRDGVIPVGSYLADAAARFGVRFEDKCIPPENIHFCRVTVTEGGGLLSPETTAETETFEKEPAEAGERLACQAKIVKPGDIIIMTKEKKGAEAQAEEREREYSKEFADLPLEKKFAELVQLEAIALGETFSFILNSPYLVFDKVVDIMAGFGMKKEENGKKASRPAEHSQSKSETVEAESADNESNSTSGEDSVNAE